MLLDFLDKTVFPAYLVQKEILDFLVNLELLDYPEKKEAPVFLEFVVKKVMLDYLVFPAIAD